MSFRDKLREIAYKAAKDYVVGSTYLRRQSSECVLFGQVVAVDTAGNYTVRMVDGSIQTGRASGSSPLGVGSYVVIVQGVIIS